MEIQTTNFWVTCSGFELKITCVVIYLPFDHLKITELLNWDIKYLAFTLRPS